MVPADDDCAIGEILIFPDSVAVLLRLKGLEGFRSEGPWHHYRIVMPHSSLKGGNPCAPSAPSMGLPNSVPFAVPCPRSMGSGRAVIEYRWRTCHEAR